MTPTPPSTTSSNSGGQSPDQAHRIVRKRNRVPLSCAPCRHRKLKCNRAQPCDNCVKRGDSASCGYAAPGSRKRSSTGAGPASSPDEMQSRIDRLENLVLSLMTSGGQTGGPVAAAALLDRTRSNLSLEATQEEEDDSLMRDKPVEDESDIERVAQSIGVMKVQNDRQFFASEAHWWAILSDIAEVKSYFSEHKKQYEEQVRKVKASKTGESSAGTSLLFKGTSKVERADIFAKFPHKPVAEKLIQRYFTSENPAARMLHQPTFWKEFHTHWREPEKTSVVWLGMCYAMFCLALQSYHRAGDEPIEYRGKAWNQAYHFLECASQCIVFSDFTQPITYMIETLCFYMKAELTRIRDAETGIWVLIGIITRLAMRMGMHRDSKPYAAISAFQGEMRRRKWAVIRSADILLSFQAGLPSMIKTTETDTALPSNLYDEDLDENMTTLPAPRSKEDNTPIAYMISETALTLVFGKILESCQQIVPITYDETMKLDGELREARAQIPQHLQLNINLQDSPTIIMQRYALDLLYYKSQCVLHRRFLARARENPRYAYSRRTCIDACLEMLRHQSALHAECQPGGQLRKVTWSTTTSLTTHDFLLAAMIICLDLYHTAQAEAQGRTSGDMYTWALERREVMFDAIKRAVAIWETLRDQSLEAYKAAAVLTVMLEKLRNHQALRQQLQNNFSFAEPKGGGVAPDGHVAPEHSAAMTLGMMSSGGMMAPTPMSVYDPRYLAAQRAGLATPQASADSPASTAQQQAAPGAEAMSPFSSLFGTSFANFSGIDLQNPQLDWDAWDTYTQGSNNVDGTQQQMAQQVIDSALLDGTYDSQVSPQQQYPSRQLQTPWTGGNAGIYTGLGSPAAQ